MRYSVYWITSMLFIHRGKDADTHTYTHTLALTTNMFQQCTEYLHRTSKISSFFFVGCFVVVVVVVVFVVVVSMDGEEEQQGGWGGGIEYFVSLKTGEKFHLSHQNLDEAAFVSINRAPSIVLFCIFFSSSSSCCCCVNRTITYCSHRF